VSDQRPPKVLLAATGRSTDVIFTPQALSALRGRFAVVEIEGDAADAELERQLPDAFAIVGQPDLPAERLQRARELRAVLNVEGNFFANVDYDTCFRNGVRVLGCGPAYADAVAEYALGLAIDLARGISREDRAFRAGRERYLEAGNAGALHLRGSDIGLIGYGNLGRALHRLLVPFVPTLRINDPWLPASVIAEAGAQPAKLEELLRSSVILFMLATVTPESAQLLNRDRVKMMRRGSRLVLISRAAVADYDAVLDRVAAGELLAAIDVWPEEPMPPGHRARAMEGLVLSAHRAGGTTAAFHRIGDMVLDDLTLISRGLPPARMQVAARELVGRYRNRPAT
jgi:phosphoglycerate dehydrogenase-like enzyme